MWYFPIYEPPADWAKTCRRLNIVLGLKALHEGGHREKGKSEEQQPEAETTDNWNGYKITQEAEHTQDNGNPPCQVLWSR